MVNLLGDFGYEGPAVYQGLEEVLKFSGVYIHLYGKSHTKPFRKMGHTTIVDEDILKARQKARIVKEMLKVVS
jgi:5-(carboxyamino)imidazole ribonucleotide synthase